MSLAENKKDTKPCKTVKDAIITVNFTAGFISNVRPVVINRYGIVGKTEKDIFVAIAWRNVNYVLLSNSQDFDDPENLTLYILGMMHVGRSK